MVSTALLHTAHVMHIFLSWANSKPLNMAFKLALLVLLAISFASGHYVKPNKYLTNCFTEEETGKCESTWVKICGDYYACDLAIPFHSHIKRIGYIDDHILVAEGTHTYLIDERYEEKKLVKKTIPPWSESVDKHGNKYYPGDGTTYVNLNKTGQEIEIITTGEHSTNQLALDVHANKLFILTFSKGHNHDVAGNLFAMNINPLPIKHDKIQAESVKADESITAMAVQGGLEKLLLGTRTKHGGKLIRLNRVKENPCSRKEVQKAEIFHVLSDATSQLAEFIDESDKIDTSESGHLEEEYTKLKHEQNETVAKINELVSKVFTIEHKLKSDHHEHIKNLKDIDFDSLKDSEYKTVLEELQDKLKKYSSGFDDIMNDPLIYSHREIAVEEYN